jgi:hypothetical protein
MAKMYHPSANGLKTDTQYLEMIQRNYPSIPLNVIKKIEKKYWNETEMNEKLREIEKEYNHEHI